MHIREVEHKFKQSVLNRAVCQNLKLLQEQRVKQDDSLRQKQVEDSQRWDKFKVERAYAVDRYIARKKIQRQAELIVKWIEIQKIMTKLIYNSDI